MAITKMSKPGLDAVAGHESFVGRAYLCPAGVVTIGYGFTMGSRVFANYWRTKYGRDLRLGDTLSREEADRLFPLIVDTEYGAAVVRDVAPKHQHHYDGSTSMTFNCGTGATKWKWAKALAAGNVAEAANLIRVTAVTANGRRLPGLVRRRGEEADMVQFGRYPSPAPVQNSDDVRWYQEILKELGYYNLSVDGVRGPVTIEAVKNFQLANGLTVDGIVGPATRATLIRVSDERRTGSAGVGSGALVGGGTATETIVNQSFEWTSVLSILGFGVTAFVLVVAASYVFRHRGRLFGTGRVPT